jgi:hypothetical protein
MCASGSGSSGGSGGSGSKSGGGKSQLGRQVFRALGGKENDAPRGSTNGAGESASTSGGSGGGEGDRSPSKSPSRQRKLASLDSNLQRSSPSHGGGGGGGKPGRGQRAADEGRSLEQCLGRAMSPAIRQELELTSF